MRYVELRYLVPLKAVGLLIQLGAREGCVWTVICLCKPHPGGSQVLYKEPGERDKPISVNCLHCKLLLQ